MLCNGSSRNAFGLSLSGAMLRGDSPRAYLAARLAPTRARFGEGALAVPFIATHPHKRMENIILKWCGKVKGRQEKTEPSPNSCARAGYQAQCRRPASHPPLWKTNVDGLPCSAVPITPCRGERSALYYLISLMLHGLRGILCAGEEWKRKHDWATSSFHNEAGVQNHRVTEASRC